MRILQIIVPFFIAGLGTCFAGIFLDHVQHWDVFEKYDELFLLLPAILGLKGNLQMTLASRLSTHSHLGHIQTQADLLGLTCANLSINQCLSVVISLSASTLVTLIHLISSVDSSFDPQRLLIISAAALLTSSITSFCLDVLMVLLVQVASYYDINPDNVAIPIAASLGDMTALLFCSHLASLFYRSRESSAFYWLAAAVIIGYILLVPVWINISKHNPHTESYLNKAEHWYPLFTAMIISTLGGIIFQIASAKSEDIALFQPVICGVGGNLVAVQASRLATQLHRESVIGELPEQKSICLNPCDVVCSEEPHYQVTQVLLAVVIPGQIIFYFVCVSLNSKRYGISFYFLLLYLIGSQVHVMLLIYFAFVLTFCLWDIRVDPDNCTIPYLTSVSDVSGSLIITAICFMVAPSQVKPP